MGTKPNKLRKDEFWALDDVSFEVRRGETLGIIGPNGSGKSTILKMLNGIYMPDNGKIEINGRVGALIEIGAGFHPMLTGRENIYVNGAILGMDKEEMDEKFDDIVEFADIGDFIDTPVKFYSSGMFVRLGFAVAVHCEPEILLVDEVLSVGDMSFQKKCADKIDELMSLNKAIIVVSHSLYRIESMCQRAIWLNKGHEVKQGPTIDVINAYLNAQDQNSHIGDDHGDKKFTEQSAPVVIDRVELANPEGTVTNGFAVGEGMTVRIFYTANQRIERPLFNIRIKQDGRGILDAAMLIDGYTIDWIKGAGCIECHFESLPLTPKAYDVDIFVRNKNGMVDLAEMSTYARFNVIDKLVMNIPMEGPYAWTVLRRGSVVYTPYKWVHHAGDD
jgi:ABC-type polysaccharide/polyol phosphate transport system ATPase subunit